MRIVFTFYLLISLGACSMSTFKEPKINGVSFVASRDSIFETHVIPVLRINANYAAIMPYGFIRSVDEPDIIYNSKRQWFGESKLGAEQYIRELSRHNVKTMMKPHLWIRGEFTGHMTMTSDHNWEQLKLSYTSFILEYAALAESTKKEIFCIGTELEAFIKYDSKYWFNLIKQIKSVYSGKLTYAANWDEYDKTPFWSELDYIGVDAYFPVSNAQTPSVNECLNGWESHKKEIKAVSDKFNKPILFTEFGYRSVDFSGREPWKSDRYNTSANLIAQNNTTTALFETFWKEDWFSGGFIWKWFHNYETSGGELNNQFTPQNKPVEEIIKDYYLTY